ncbi:hypothetical protein [Mucilaginibacter sp.]|uniref:hypothetical protein n=1 Tax=Mucilaginibacter sp. TaxID=1882438 RepID=UPI003B00D250
MTFDNITNGHKCDCLSKTSIPKSEEVYLRKLRKEDLADKDFETHWERGIGVESEGCDDICNYKALSINKTSNEIETLIYEHYKTTFTINPKKGGHCLKFKFKEEAGKVIHAPIENADSHHNFFKSDLFTFDYIEPVDVIKFV